MPNFSKQQLKIMNVLWTNGASSIRQIQQSFPFGRRPAYTTVQTVVYRLEIKNAVQRVKKIGNAHIFDAKVSRWAALLDDASSSRISSSSAIARIR